MPADDLDGLPTDPRDLLGRVVARGEVLRRRRMQVRRTGTAAAFVFLAGIVSLVSVDGPGDREVVTTPPPSVTSTTPSIWTFVPDPPDVPGPTTTTTTSTTATSDSGAPMPGPPATTAAPAAGPAGPRTIPTIVYDRAVGEANEIVVLPSGAAGPYVLVAGTPFLNSVEPSLSPDGTEVAIATTRQSLVNGLRSAFDIWIHPLDGGPPRRITTTNDLQDTAASYPAWSPDGTHIAFAGADAAGHVWLVGTDGSGSHPLPSGPEGRVAVIRWSPDGRFLSYLSPTTIEGPGHLRILDLATDTDRAVDVPLVQGPASWTADGQALLYSRGPAGASVVYRYDLQTGTETFVPTGGSDYFPAPCGVDQIVVMRDDDGDGPAPATVVAMGLDGSRPTAFPAAAPGAQPRLFSCGPG